MGVVHCTMSPFYPGSLMQLSESQVCLVCRACLDMRFRCVSDVACCGPRCALKHSSLEVWADSTASIYHNKSYLVSHRTRIAMDASLSAWAVGRSLQAQAAAECAPGLLGSAAPLPTRAHRGGADQKRSSFQVASCSCKWSMHQRPNQVGGLTGQRHR